MLGVYLASIIQGKFFRPLLSCSRMGAPYDESGSASAISQVKNCLLIFLLVLNYSQLHSTWSDGFDTCNMPNRGHDIFSPIMMISVDVASIFIKFLGLLRLRSRGGGMFDLGRLLWKQVRWRQSWESWRSQSSNPLSVRKGVIWLLFSTATGFVSVASIVNYFVLCPHRRCIL
jgi:hypothetical protein